jgi:hypothetical protein
MKPDCELSSRTSIRAFYSYEHLLIVAEGELPTPGYDVDIDQSPIRIFPPQYNLQRCPRPGVFPQVITPFKVSDTFRVGSRPDEVTVHHADGSDQVPVEDCGSELAAYGDALAPSPAPECPEGSDQATGFSKNLSFDEAFAAAVANLPAFEPTHPDTLETVKVLEVGAFFGGIAGFQDLWIKICRTHD